MLFPHFLTPKTQKSGYPTIELIEEMKKQGSLDYLTDKFKHTFYKKDSDDVIRELEYLKFINGQTDTKLNRIVSFDTYTDEVYRICGSDYAGKKEKVLMGVYLLCLRLAYHYQRPRPSVACVTYNIPVSPVMSEWLLVPSYPNSFIVGAKLLMLIDGDKNEAAKLKDAAMCYLKAGWHYPSDNIFAYQCAEGIFNDKFFKEKINKK